MDSLSLVQRALLWVIPVLLAISVHELAHGLVALHYGDRSAQRAGRLSLNPLKHLDPLGSVVVPAAALLVGGFVFGWARPVPVDSSKLTHPRRDMVMVASAGPAANLFMSLLWAWVMNLGLWMSSSADSVGAVLVYMGAAGVFINAAVMMLNLLPLPPLDGGRIVIGLLPQRFGDLLTRFEPVAVMLLLFLVLGGLAGELLWPLVAAGMAMATYLSDTPVDVLTHALAALLSGGDDAL